MTKYYIGFDAGTMGCKVAMYADDSTLVAEAYGEHELLYPKPGWCEHRPEMFEEVIIGAIKECVAKANVDPKDVNGISCSGVICGVVPIDENWKPVGRYICYLDGRADKELKEIEASPDQPWLEEAGNMPSPLTPAITIKWWMKNDPELVKKTKKFVTNGIYIMGLLGGLKAKDAYIDWGHMNGWIIGYDIRKRDWSDKQFKAMGVPRELIPDVKKPWDIVGYLTKEMAEKVGLRAGIPLVAGSGDIFQSNLGSGIVNYGDCTDVAGTASIFTVDSKDVKPGITNVPGIIAAMSTLEGHYCYWGVIRAGGLSLRWYRDSIGGRPGDDSYYKEMDMKAKDVPMGSHNVLFYPYLQGGDESLPNANASFLGMYGHTDQAVLWRSMMESIAYEYYSWVTVFRDQGIDVKEITGTGGGSKSNLWAHIKADILGADYKLPKRSEGAVLANALVAAYGVGDIKDIPTTIKKWIEYKETIKPNMENHAAYDKIYKVRQAILGGPMTDIFAKIKTLG